MRYSRFSIFRRRSRRITIFIAFSGNPSIPDVRTCSHGSRARIRDFPLSVSFACLPFSRKEREIVRSCNGILWIFVQPRSNENSRESAYVGALQRCFAYLTPMREDNAFAVSPTGDVAWRHSLSARSPLITSDRDLHCRRARLRQPP